MWICFTQIFLFPSYHLFFFPFVRPESNTSLHLLPKSVNYHFPIKFCHLYCSHCRSSSTKLNCSHGSNSFCWLDIVFHLCFSHSNSLVTFTISILLLLNSFRSTMAKADKTMQMNAEKLRRNVKFFQLQTKIDVGCIRYVKKVNVELMY